MFGDVLRYIISLLVAVGLVFHGAYFTCLVLKRALPVAEYLVVVFSVPCVYLLHQGLLRIQRRARQN